MSKAAIAVSKLSWQSLDSSRHFHSFGEEMLQGYLQISLAHDGTLQVRGTRSLMDWLSYALASDGWCIVFEDNRWCG